MNMSMELDTFNGDDGVDGSHKETRGMDKSIPKSRK